MTAKNVLVALSISFFFFSNASGQTAFRLPPAVKLIAKKMARHNIYESYTVGFSGTISTQYELFSRLVKVASDQELLELADFYRNPVVRIYALKALKAKGEKIPEALINRFDKDSSHVQILNGCIGGYREVSGIAMEIMKPRKSPLPGL